MRNAETKVLTLEKQLVEAQNYVRKLNEDRYEGIEFPEEDTSVAGRTVITSRDRRSIKMLTEWENVFL